MKPVPLLILAAVLAATHLRAAPPALPADLAARIALRRSQAAQDLGWRTRLPPAIVVHADLAYASRPGSAPGLTQLDAYTSSRLRGAPLVVFVHGGGFSAGDKAPAALVENKARFFPAHGLLFVSVNYRLAPEATFPAPVEDVAAALAFVRAHAVSWGGDPDAIFLIGHSAGAQLVAHLATQPGFLAAAGVPMAALRGVISVDSDFYDLAFAWDESGSEPLVRQIIALEYGATAADRAGKSTFAALSPAHPLPPLLLFHANDPSSLSQRATLRFAARVRAVGGVAEVAPAREKDHSHLGRDIGTPGDWITAKVMAFIGRYRPSPQGENASSTASQTTTNAAAAAR